jgi:SAM-dependent methyltransferase
MTILITFLYRSITRGDARSGRPVATLSYSSLPPPGLWRPEDVSSPEEEFRSPLIDAAHPSSARVYDYLLGGKDNFAADRVAADRITEAFPAIRVGARENRMFLLRGVRYLAAEAGVRQFLDIGTGIPTSPNVHEVVQGITPAAHVAYVDNDPIVLAHARALMVSDPRGRVGYLDADVRDPEAIIDSALVRSVLDFTEPVALILSAILHFIPDEQEPGRIVGTFVDALPPGSYVLATHVTPEHEPRLRPASAGYRDDGVRTQARTAAEFERLVFTGRGLELVDPGVVLVSQWRRDPEDPPAPPPAQVSAYGGLAVRKA